MLGNREPDMGIWKGRLSVSRRGVERDIEDGLRQWTYEFDGSPYDPLGVCPECGRRHEGYWVGWEEGVGLVLICPSSPTPAEILARAGEELA